jgi:hypothetical protein
LGDESSSVEIYGQINKGLLVYDDGHAVDTYFPVDNDNSSTRAGIWLRHQVDPEWSIAVNVEGQWAPYSTSYVNQLTKGNVDWDTALLRKLEAYIDLAAFGRLWLGQGSMASDGTAETNLSGTSLVGYSSVADSASAQLYRLEDGTLSSVSVGDTFSNLDGLGRKLRVRYDTPSLHGFVLATSIGQQVIPSRSGDTVWDVALKYNATLADYKLAAAIAFSDPGGSGRGVLDGSASVLHAPTGWSMTVAAGYENQTTRDRQFGYAKLGHQAQYVDAGTTFYSVDLYYGDDIRTNASESWSVGGQLVQELETWRSELYLGLRSYVYEDDSNEYERGFSTLAGIRVKL